MWRVGYLSRLLEQRQEHHYLAQVYEEKRLANLIDSLCVNYKVNSLIYEVQHDNPVMNHGIFFKLIICTSLVYTNKP